MIKTQKAKGIINGLPYLFDSCGYEVLAWFYDYIKHDLVQHKKDIDNVGLPCFARPCPTVPRHGFVDSRVVGYRDQLHSLWGEIIKQDPNGEMILGPCFPNVEYNAVYVNSGLLSIGVGNDGATAGKNSISFPVAPHKFNNFVLKESGLTKKDAAYIESIYTRDKWHLTQIRGGPSISSSSPDYIPKSVTVKKIVSPNLDLLQWEKQVKEFTKGTVVYAPDHTLASHAAIHCVLENIPFITTFKPRVGQKLSKVKSKTHKINRDNFRCGFMSGIEICNNSFDIDLRKLLYYSFSVLHNWAYLRGCEHSDWLLGSACSVFSKICVALLSGEFRYYRNPCTSEKRSGRYQKILNSGLKCFDSVPKMFSEFYNGKWESGFGGIPWANCAYVTSKFFGSVVKQYNKSTKYLSEKDMLSVVGEMNKTINAVHNNGWWIDKIANKKDLDCVSINPGMSSLAVSDVFFDAYNKFKNLIETKNIPTSLHFDGIKDAIEYKDNLIQITMYDYMCGEMRITYTDLCGEYEDAFLEIDDKVIRKISDYINDKGLNKWDPIPLPISKSGNVKIPGMKWTNIKELFNHV